MRSDYCDAELAADHIVHVVALTAGTAGTLAMLAQAAVSTKLPIFCALAVYSLALLAMLGASAAHNVGRTRGNEVIRRLDHAAIFLLIAGTYTPFTVRFLSDEMASAATAGVWCAALAGAAMKLQHPRRFERLSILLYLALGWQGLFLLPSLFASLPQPVPLLIVTGGGLYSVGVAFHIWETLPFQNAIWHGFVVFAAGCHYAAIWQAVMPPGT